MLEEIKRATDPIFIWSDEKIFTVEAVLNRQNDQIYTHDAKHFPEGSRSHLRHDKPVDVMVWVAVVSNVSKSPLLFIPEEITVNSQIYVEMLKSKVLAWFSEQFENNYVFTQDGAPSHISNLTQKWCKDHFCNFWDKISSLHQTQILT